MGRFYEIESSSPAAALARVIPFAYSSHYSFKGHREDLDKVSMKILGKPVDAIKVIITYLF
jgi:hypothetical protein